MWAIFKVFIELVTTLLLFNVLDLGAISHVRFLLPNQVLNSYPLLGRRSLNHWTTKVVPV